MTESLENRYEKLRNKVMIFYFVETYIRCPTDRNF